MVHIINIPSLVMNCRKYEAKVEYKKKKKLWKFASSYLTWPAGAKKCRIIFVHLKNLIHTIIELFVHIYLCIYVLCLYYVYM